MNKKILIATGVLVGVTAIAVGGIAYVAKSNLEARQQAIMKNFSTLGGSVSSQFKLEAVSSDLGLFKSSGQYRLSYNDPEDSKMNGSLLIDYSAEHGFKSWFGEDIPFVANGKTEGNIVKTLQIKSGSNDGLSFQLKGLVKEDGSMVADKTINDFSLVIPKPSYQNDSQEQQANGAANDLAGITPKNDKPNGGMLVRVEGGVANFNISSGDGSFKTNYTYKSIGLLDLEDPTDKILISELNASYDSNIKNLDIGKFKTSIGLINNGTDNVSAKGTELEASIEEVNKKYNIKFGTKVKDLTILAQKNSSFEIAYSIKGVDAKMMHVYKNATQAFAAGKELSEEDQKNTQQSILDSLKTGFSFNIEKIKFQNETSFFDLSGSYEIVPTKDGDKFSFQKQSKFNGKVEANGELAILANSLFGNLLATSTPESSPAAVAPGTQASVAQAETAQAPVVQDSSKFNLTFNFDNAGLTINEKPSQSVASEAILNTLKTVDERFGLAPKEETQIIEEVIQPTEPKTETPTTTSESNVKTPATTPVVKK